LKKHSIIHFFKPMNKLDAYYKQQLSYFGKEFSRIHTYSLLPWQKSYILKIKKYLLGKKPSGKTLIDIGTGSGYVAIETAKMGLHVIACDLTEEALDNIKRFKRQFKLSNIKLVKCNAEKIPLPDRSVDYVIANAILEHIPDEQKAIREWKRLLKPNGKIFIAVPLQYKYIWPFLIPLNYIHDRRIGHLRRYDYASLVRKFNLEPIAHFYTGHFIKVLGSIIFVTIFRTYIFARIFENIDSLLEKRRYGASNIIMVMKKEKK